MKLDSKYHFLWWMGSVGLAIVWVAFAILLIISANDTPFLWESDQTPWVGRIGLLVLMILTAGYLRLGRAGWKACLGLIVGIAGPILLLGGESAILGLFGSPTWETVQAWARIHYPDQTWVEEPLRPQWSACGAYCWDVRIWGEIRVILGGGY